MNSWNTPNENLIQNWKKRAEYYQILYLTASNNVSQKEWWFGVPLIILACVTTSSIFYDLDGCNKYQQIASCTLCLLYTLLTAVGNLLKYGTKKVLYQQSAEWYGNLVLDIQEQLSRAIQDRENASDFIVSLKISLRTVKKDSPDIPESVFKQYIKDLDKCTLQISRKGQS
jgi:hypothetical protein